MLTRGTLQSSLRTSAKVSRESQGLARPSPQLRRPPVCVWSPGRQALTKPGRATERPAGSRTWGTVLPRGQAGPAPQARGLAGFPSRFCTTEASVTTALSEKPSPRTNSLMLHAHLRCTPRVAGVKDACLRAHSGAAGRDPSCKACCQILETPAACRQRRLPSSESSETRRCGRWSVLWVRTSPQQGPGRNESDRSALSRRVHVRLCLFRERPRTELTAHCELRLPLLSGFSSHAFPSLSSESLLVAECLLVS